MDYKDRILALEEVLKIKKEDINEEEIKVLIEGFKAVGVNPLNPEADSYLLDETKRVKLSVEAQAIIKDKVLE